MTERRVYVYPSQEQLVPALCELVLSIIADCVDKRGACSVGLSGGSLVNFLSEGLPKSQEFGSIDWNKVTFFYCDERLVPPDSQDFTHKLYQDALFDKLPAAPTVLSLDTSLPLESASVDYEQKLSAAGILSSGPDVVLLGIGPDGHTCSLFPDHLALNEQKVGTVPISDSPKPPPERVTCTLPLINKSSNAIFALTGAAKAPIVAQLLAADAPPSTKLPCSLVRPTAAAAAAAAAAAPAPSPKLFVLLDKPAAGDAKC